MDYRIGPLQVEEIAERAAEKSARLVLLQAGVDVDDPEWRERFEFLKRMERGAREVKRATIKTCVGAIVTGLVAVLVMGFLHWIGRQG